MLESCALAFAQKGHVDKEYITQGFRLMLRKEKGVYVSGELRLR